MIKEECGIADIDWKSPANTGTGFEERYLDAVKKAEAAGMLFNSATIQGVTLCHCKAFN